MKSSLAVATNISRWCISSNRAFKYWAETFNHDSTLTSALLDRLLRHAETVVIEGKSYRMRDQVDPLLPPPDHLHYGEFQTVRVT